MASLSDYPQPMVGQCAAICKENRQNCKEKQRAAGAAGTTAKATSATAARAERQDTIAPAHNGLNARFVSPRHSAVGDGVTNL
jgi:hypothetical protein